MSSLRLIQRDLQNYILTGADPILGQVVSTEKVSAGERLNIYADAYRLRLVEVLESSYPSVKVLLGGDEEFREMGFAYIAAHPSPYFNVRWYGDRLAEFLRTASPYRDRPILAEMAAFEWAMTLTFDAPDQPLASIEDVARIAPEDWPSMRYIPDAALHRLDLRWNVPAIWKAIDGGTEPASPEESSSPTPWLLWRRELKIYFRSLSEDEAWATDAMIDGADFGEICEGLCEWVDAEQVALHAAGILKRWLADGLIHDINCTP